MKNFPFILIALLLAACSALAAPTAAPTVLPTSAPTVAATSAPTAPPTALLLPSPTWRGAGGEVSPTPTPTASKVLIVAHRGGAGLEPENTLAAFENALKIGVDTVECDVHLSRDDKLIVMHDSDVSRTTNGTGQIRHLTLAELKQLNAAAKFAGGYARQSIPTLAELLDLVKGKANIQIEIKTAAGNTHYPGIERRVVDLVNARGMTNSVVVISFDFPTLKKVKAIDPRLKTGALVNTAWMAARMLASPERIFADAIDATGADYFMPPANSVFVELVQAVHARGLKIGVWTVNAGPEMQRLAGYGVDAITSDKPDELKRMLGR